MNLLYNTGIHAYGAAARTLGLWNDKVKKMISGQRRTFDCLRKTLGEGSKCVWFHAASLGEFEQARPMIERLRREQPQRKILLTFFSPSGYEVRKNYDKVDAVAYLPFDTPRNARRFIDIADPSMAIFVKYEFWGNYLQQLAKRDIPTYIISSIFREKQIFFKSWGGTFRKILRNFNRMYVQDEKSRTLLESIGISDVTVAGDTRFDRVTDIMASRVDIPSIEQLHPFLIAGSSWPTDEEKYIPWLNAHPEVTFVIAPHEFDDSRIERLIKSIDGKVVRFSDIEKGADGSDYRGVVIDCFGKLSSIYRYGRVAYIGGGFGTGIHNINEAAVYDMPVVFGPKHEKFKEAHDLIKKKGGFSVGSREETAAVLDRFYTDSQALELSGKIAGDYIRENIGATSRIYADLFLSE